MSKPKWRRKMERRQHERFRVRWMWESLLAKYIATAAHDILMDAFLFGTGWARINWPPVYGKGIVEMIRPIEEAYAVTYQEARA